MVELLHATLMLILGVAFAVESHNSCNRARAKDQRTPQGVYVLLNIIGVFLYAVASTTAFILAVHYIN